jgi:hypothetical protein
MKENTMKRIALFSLLVAVPLLTGPLPSRAQVDRPDDILIVANKGAPIDKLSEEEIQEIFLRIRRVIGSGTPVTPVNAREDSALRKEFRERILQMSPEKEGRYWEDKKISLGLTAPPEFSSPLKAIFKLQNSVGYVFRSEYLQGVVKILAVVPNNQASKN